eukprot:2462878-Rhodomonas_salina.3
MLKVLMNRFRTTGVISRNILVCFVFHAKQEQILRFQHAETQCKGLSLGLIQQNYLISAAAGAPSTRAVKVFRRFFRLVNETWAPLPHPARPLWTRALKSQLISEMSTKLSASSP